ncbi:MAG: hypothetical protein KA984_05675 [Candidatus Cloacimonetes bacterium]|nr:hypothetical protein [Candidatus Cloacimonadota bacterium]
MKRSLLWILVISTLLFAACAGPRGSSKEAMLRAELAKWESFDSQGVVEISYMGLAMRKMFAASKNHQELRIDIFDGGVLGAGAAPMLSFYSGDYLAFKSPFLPMLEAFDLSGIIPAEGLKLFSSADELYNRYGEQILKNKALDVEGVQISFNKKYQLTEVIDPKSSSRLEARYTANGTLQDLQLSGPDNLSLKLAFDEIKYLEPQITPLPKSEGAGILDGLINLQEMDLKQLLKSILGNK